MRQHHQEHAGEEPRHLRLAQHRQRARRAVSLWAPSAAGGSRHSDPASRAHMPNHDQRPGIGNAEPLQHEAGHDHRDARSRSSPRPACGRSGRRRAAVGRLKVCASEASVIGMTAPLAMNRQRHASHADRGDAVTPGQGQRQRRDGARRTRTRAAALTRCGCGRPASPSRMARTAACPRLQRRDRADGQLPTARAAEPQRRVEAEQTPMAAK